MLGANTSVAEAARRMHAKRTDCALVTGLDGLLQGIVTDTDLTRRVVAAGVDSDLCEVGSVMTANPTCVMAHDSAMEALGMMAERGFRQFASFGVAWSWRLPQGRTWAEVLVRFACAWNAQVGDIY